MFLFQSACPVFEIQEKNLAAFLIYNAMLFYVLFLGSNAVKSYFLKILYSPNHGGKLESLKIFSNQNYLSEETSQFQGLLFMTLPPGRIRIWCTRKGVYIFWPQSHGRMRNFGICSRNCFSRNIKLEPSRMRTENMRVNHKVDLVGCSTSINLMVYNT